MAKKFGKVCIGSTCFEVEIAKTFFKKAFGLMFRPRMDKNKGMLFVFNREKIIPIWTFGMLFPLDILWIDSNNKIVHVRRNVRKFRGTFPIFCPPSPAKYILEINSGLSENIHLGDKALIEI